MNKDNLFNEEEILHRIVHYLPAQNPLKDFIHHNTLHAFQDLDFHQALSQANAIFGYKTYLSLEEFREKYEKGDISKKVILRTISKYYGEEEAELWYDKMINQKYDESVTPTIGKLRVFWKQLYAINLEKSTHTILFRLLCAYLDQGIAIWPFPVRADGFINSLKILSSNGMVSLFQNTRAKKLLEKDVTIYELLKILVGDESYYEAYLFDQQFAHPGWSGLVAAVEHNPASLLDHKLISLREIIILELLLEIDLLDSKFGEHWSPLSYQVPIPPYEVLKHKSHTELMSIQKLWQESYEWSYYDEVLAGISATSNTEEDNSQPTFQAMFCMDDRECSLRRHLEALEPQAITYGTAAFFNFEFFYQPVYGKFYTKLCPAPLSPKFLIKELPRKKKIAKDLYTNKRSHSLLFGWMISQTLGFAAAVKLFVNIFKPRMTPATTSSFGHLHIKSKLHILHEDTDEKIDGLQLGFTISEMADRVESLLKSIGLVSNFAPIVYVIGHGATSVNNTHFAGYDCGACSGRPSSVNAKVFCFAANHPKVRLLLAERNIHIPAQTQFLPGLHDTTRDEIRFYDEILLNSENKIKHSNIKNSFETALENNAIERSRRFDTINKNTPTSKIHEKVKRRSLSLFEPRPELNHATNAMCIVGRRKVSERLFLDRRSFLNSYDYRIDKSGDYLANILGAVAPVAGGINLEYYFSRVDNHKLGAGSKLPHNVMGLIGVANGIDGDLRPGLPSQMIELHDPIRLLIVVEQLTDIVLYAIRKNPKTLQWFDNNWVNLVVKDPITHKLYRYENKGFTLYTPIATSVSRINNIQEFVSSSSSNLKVSILPSPIKINN